MVVSVTLADDLIVDFLLSCYVSPRQSVTGGFSGPMCSNESERARERERERERERVGVCERERKRERESERKREREREA